MKKQLLLSFSLMASSPLYAQGQNEFLRYPTYTATINEFLRYPAYAAAIDASNGHEIRTGDYIAVEENSTGCIFPSGSQPDKVIFYYMYPYDPNERFLPVGKERKSVDRKEIDTYSIVGEDLLQGPVVKDTDNNIYVVGVALTQPLPDIMPEHTALSTVIKSSTGVACNQGPKP